MSNESIVKWLTKRGPVDLDDPLTRISTIGALGSIRSVKRENVRVAVDVYTRSKKKDRVIDSKNEREELALLITRQANRNSPSVAFARVWGSGKEALRRRKWQFGGSSGKGVRTFDKRWRGHLIADARTKSNAENLAKFLRKNQVGKVRIVPYQSGKRTHFSVYSERAVDIASRKDLKEAKKHMKPNEIKQIERRIDPRSIKHRSVKPLLTTKKNIPKLGLRLKR